MQNKDTNLQTPPTLDQLNAIVDSAAKQPNAVEQRQRYLAQLIDAMRISVNDNIPADICTLRVGTVDTFAREGLHFIKAKAKQGKSSALCILESAYLGPSGLWGCIQRITPNPLKVIHFDTEQKPFDSQQFKRQVLRLADTTEDALGSCFTVVNMRSIADYQLKQQLVEWMIQNEHPDVVVIDGVVDLMGNFNDLDESKFIINWLMALADKHKCVMFCVLHTNKNVADNNMRGHLGTMCEQKCDTTIECIKDVQSNIVTVKCAIARHRPFPEWAFTWDSYGNLLDANEQRAKQTLRLAEAAKAQRAIKARETQDQRIHIMLQTIYCHGGSIDRKELVMLLMDQLGINRHSASVYISSWIKDNIIYEANHRIRVNPQIELFDDAEG